MAQHSPYWRISLCHYMYFAIQKSHLISINDMFQLFFFQVTEITPRRCLLSSHKFLNHTTFANPRQLRPLKQHSREFTSRRGIGAYEVFRAVQHLKEDSHRFIYTWVNWWTWIYIWWNNNKGNALKCMVKKSWDVAESWCQFLISSSLGTFAASDPVSCGATRRISATVS